LAVVIQGESVSFSQSHLLHFLAVDLEKIHNLGGSADLTHLIFGEGFIGQAQLAYIISTPHHQQSIVSDGPIMVASTLHKAHRLALQVPSSDHFGAHVGSIVPMAQTA